MYIWKGKCVYKRGDIFCEGQDVFKNGKPYLWMRKCLYEGDKFMKEKMYCIYEGEEVSL